MATTTVKKNLQTNYGGVTQATIIHAIDDAKNQLKATPDINYIVEIPAGTWNLLDPGDKATIDVSNVVAGSNGRFILRGAGRELTTLVQNDALLGVNGSNFKRVTISDMTMTRPKMKVSQGYVVTVKAGQVVLRIQEGFPTPMELHSGESGKGAGRYLRKFSNSATDPQLVVNNNNQISWEDASLVQGTSRDWAMRQNDSGKVAPYRVGELIAIKSKHGADAYKFSDGDGIFFSNVIWFQESRGAFRHVNKVHVGNSKILRAPAINGQVPCLSTPDGGPQVGQPGDGPITGANVEDCYFVGTGDDGIAFFNSTGVARNNYIQDAFARGINLYHTNGLNPTPTITCTNNTMVRCQIEDTSYNQRT